MTVYTRGHNPKSLENLRSDARKPEYGEKKKSRGISLTDTGTNGLKALAHERNLSLGELLEQIGRGKIQIHSN
jgi:hypothetical protein